MLVENARSVSTEGAYVRQTRKVTVEPRATVHVPESNSYASGAIGIVAVGVAVAVFVWLAVGDGVCVGSGVFDGVAVIVGTGVNVGTSV